MRAVWEARKSQQEEVAGSPRLITHCTGKAAITVRKVVQDISHSWQHILPASFSVVSHSACGGQGYNGVHKVQVPVSVR